MVNPLLDRKTVNYAAAIAPSKTVDLAIQVNNLLSSRKLRQKNTARNPFFSILSVTLWQWKWVTSDPNELPSDCEGSPPRYQILEQVACLNGTEPFVISNGQFVKIVIAIPLSNTARIACGEYITTSMIQGEGADLVPVKLYAIHTQVKSKTKH